MNVNIGYEDMLKPVLGPDNPFSERKLANQNSIAGNVVVSNSVL
jgi:pre-mRNA-processing factor 17